MSYRKTIATILSLATASLFAATSADAAVRCETQYGGGRVCVTTGNLQINKEVFDPKENKFVDNLGINDHRFAPGDEVTFRLKIKNVGDATLITVNVSDVLPSMLELSSGVKDFELTDLTVGKTEEREFKAKVVGSDKFPSDKNLVCVVNTAEAKSGDQSDKDTAQLCLEKKVAAPAPKALPPTGPEGVVIALITSVIAAGSGLYLLKFRAK
ncbi:hypothetical protein HYZ78_00940 [Candidatus Microgenomates bacterium]|nr:hypothetical protein [Candidatus Microgenomates bacterium]